MTDDDTGTTKLLDSIYPLIAKYNFVLIRS